LKPFDTSLLDAVLMRRRQENEQQRLDLLTQVMAWLDANAADYGIDRAYLFGSITRPHRFAEASDVDIAVEQIDPDRFFTAMGTLMETLERDVDLVELSKCHFADRIRQRGLLWTRN
jgi:uncharacterized protein